MAKHIAPRADDGSVPSPAQQIIIDVMAAAFACISVRSEEGFADAVKALRVLKFSQYGFDDTGFVQTLRANGYYVDTTDTALLIAERPGQ